MHAGCAAIRVALDVFGGSLGGRAPGQTFIVGGRATYFPIRQLGIGAAYGYSRGIGGLDTVRRRSVHFAHGQLEVPFISALRVGRHKVIQMDVFAEGGGDPARSEATHHKLLHFLGRSEWDDRPIRMHAARFGIKQMQQRAAITHWIIDDTGFLK